MTNILMATLGESPIVITAMYDLLTEQERCTIDKVIVWYPHDDTTLIDLGYVYVEEALKGKCEVVREVLPFADVNSEEHSFTFLRSLSNQLKECQRNDDTVYFSLSGGRKNMSALMALIIPLFSCVKKLYHVIDKDEATRKHNLKSIEELVELTEEQRFQYLFPDRQRLRLVEIPYGEYQQVTPEFLARLSTITDESDLDELYVIAPDDTEAIDFIVQATSSTPASSARILEVMLTEQAAQQFRAMWRKDRFRAREFAFCFERMRFATLLRHLAHGIYTRKARKGELKQTSKNSSSLTFHFLKRGGKMQPRPVFHTLPKDIKSCRDEEVEQVIVSALVTEIGDEYEEGFEEIINAPDFSAEPYVTVNQLLAELNKTDPEPVSKSVLLVLLGRTPMVATQLYTLLSAQGRSIQEVVLLYPGGPGSQAIQNSADIARQAFEYEGIPCRAIGIQEIKDIDTREACEIYERELGETIDLLRQQYPEWQIDLALSGGRKGMAALAMFVAQRKGIRYLYHTLVTDEQLDEIIQNETTVNALSSGVIHPKTRNERLFLRAYEGNGPYTKFVLFRVPVLPSGSRGKAI